MQVSSSDTLVSFRYCRSACTQIAWARRAGEEGLHGVLKGVIKDPKGTLVVKHRLCTRPCNMSHHCNLQAVEAEKCIFEAVSPVFVSRSREQ